MQQSLAEYKFSKTVPGTAWNIRSERIASIDGKFLPSLAFILFACKKGDFLYETGFRLGLKFSTSHIICAECSFVFFLNRLTANHCERKTLERASISKAVLEIEVNAVIYIHTYLHINNHRSSGFRSNHRSFIVTVLFRIVRNCRTILIRQLHSLLHSRF